MSNRSALARSVARGAVGLVTLGLIIVVIAAETARGGDGADVVTTDRIPLADGDMVVCHKTRTGTADSVVVHFHGALETVRDAYARSRFSGVLVVVNFPGLSSAYSGPVAEDSRLFSGILNRAWMETHDRTDAPDWKFIALSSFSAGYGAVREVLKSDAHFERVGAVIAADSIYAGLETTTRERAVHAEHMRDFLRFARRASRGETRFVLSHSAQPTPYASTTETADYLLASLSLERLAETAIERDGLRQASGASRGGFHVLGFEGATGPDHLRHLYHIDLLWDLCLSEERESPGATLDHAEQK